MSAATQTKASEIVKDYVQKHFPKAEVAVDSLTLTDVSATAGGISMQLFKGVAVVQVDGKALLEGIPIVVKATHDSDASRATTKGVGLNREANLARDVAMQRLISPTPPTIFPLFIGAWNDDEVGSKVIVMGDLTLVTAPKLSAEDGTVLPYETKLEGVQAGYFFGGTSVHNWGKDLPAITAGFPDVQERDVSIKAASDAASLHGKFWRCGSETFAKLQSPEAGPNGERPWLRAYDWVINGTNQASFDSYATLAADAWKRFLASNGEGETSKVKVAPQLATMMNTVLETASFDRFVAHMRDGPCGYSIVHGDFHPANFMVVKSGSSWDLVLLDWEVVGLGSGPQELGQFLISHSTPAARGPYFAEMVATYTAAFKEACGGDGPTDAQVREELVLGGLGRWVWLLAYIAGSAAPPVVTQFFHDQVWQFMEEHNIVGGETFSKIVLRV